MYLTNETAILVFGFAAALVFIQIGSVVVDIFTRTTAPRAAAQKRNGTCAS